MLSGVIDIVLGVLMQIEQETVEVARDFAEKQTSNGFGKMALILLCALLLAAFVFFIAFVVVKLIQIDKTMNEIKAKQEILERRIGTGY